MSNHTPLSKIILKNSFFNTANYVSKIIIAFIITPYMLHRLGIKLFGVWTILAVITSYAQLADMGIGRSLIKFVSEYDSKKDKKGLSEIISASFGIYMFFGVLSFLALYSMQSIFVNNIFKIPVEFIEDASFVYKGVLAIFIFNLIFSVFRASINGMQRMEITNMISICSSILNAVGIFIVLELGYGIKGLVIKNGIISIIIVLSNFYFFKKVLYGIKIKLSGIKIARIKEIFKFSANVELSYIFRMMLDPLNKILIGYFGSVSLVALYEIAWKLISMALGLMWGLQYSLLPAASMVNAKSGRSSVKSLFLYSTKYLSFIVIPVFAIIFILSKPFIQAWIGDGFEVSIVTVQILIFPYMVSVLVNPATLSIQGIGYPKHSMFMIAIRGLLNLVLGYTFIQLYGYYGLIVGHAIAVIISSLYIQIIFHRIIMMPIKQTLIAVFNKIFAVNVMISIFLFALINYLNLTGYLILILSGISFFCLSFYFLMSIKWMDDKDRQILQDVLPKPIFKKLFCHD